TAGDITRLTADVTTSLVLPDTVNLDLEPGANFALHSRTVDIDGQFRSLQGSFAVNNASTVTLGPHAVIDVSGQWVNDDVRLGADSGTAPLFFKGGSIGISSSKLDLDEHAVISANGGAARSASGAIRYGSGGSIKLGAQEFVTSGGSDAFSGTVQAYAFTNGG